MRHKIDSTPIAPDRMSVAQAGRRLGLDPATIRRLVDQGHIKRLPMLPGLRCCLLASSVDELAAKMYGADRQASQAG